MMMLTPLIALVALQGGVIDNTLLGKIVPVPTGKNGYEDYLRACDIAGHGVWSKYEEMIMYRLSKLRGNNDTEDESTLLPLPPGTTLDSSDLGIRIAANDRIGGAIDIITTGNNKRVFDPRQNLSFETVFPEMAEFKMMSKVCANRAYVEFAEGKSSFAVRDLLEGLKFSRNIFDSVLISSLVSIAMQGIILAEFNRHLGQLSLSDAQMIDRACDSMIAKPYPVRDVIEHEFAMTMSSVDYVFDNPDSMLNEDQAKAIGSTIKGLNSSDRAQLKGLVQQGLQQRFEVMANRLSGPESSWPVGDLTPDPMMSLEDKSISNLALIIVYGLEGNSMQHQVTSAMAKARIQLRLLQLHAKVSEYRWQNSILPTKIEDFADAKTARDPFTGETFHYELKDGNYRLYSTGVPGLGQIELKYRNQLVAPGGGSDHP